MIHGLQVQKPKAEKPQPLPKDTARTRLKNPTVPDCRLLIHAQSWLQANPAGACVVSLLVFSTGCQWKSAPTDFRQLQFPNQTHNKTRNHHIPQQPGCQARNALFALDSAHLDRKGLDLNCVILLREDEKKPRSATPPRWQNPESDAKETSRLFPQVGLILADFKGKKWIRYLLSQNEHGQTANGT
jgi:hypothetical protein